MTEMEKNNVKKLHELLDIVLLCNGCGVSKQEITGTAPTMFYEFAGHVRTIEVRLYNNGWKPDTPYDKDWWIPLDSEISDNVIEAIRIAASKAMNSPTEQEQLEADIIKAEEEIKRRKAEITAMKRNLKAMQKKGA